MKVLITGSAGFIGHHLTLRLAELGHEVTGLDNINNYYDTSLKYNRLAQQGIIKADIKYNTIVQSFTHNICFIELSLEDNEGIEKVFRNGQFDAVINLGAQAGVRYSLENPRVYINSNIIGFFNILEACRNFKIKHLLFASSSSVYGLNKQIPFCESDHTDHPVSLYAASKKSNEVMAHSYAHLFKIPITGLRFFTVYGPWGRPDMAIYLFTKAILNEEPIKAFNYGEMLRDFTYVDDVVDGIVAALDNVPSGCQTFDAKNPDPCISSAPYRIFNIGNSKPVKLLDFIKAIEIATGKDAILELLPIQPGDVESTYASTNSLMNEVGYVPKTNIQDGVNKFVSWYKSYYKVVEPAEQPNVMVPTSAATMYLSKSSRSRVKASTEL